MVGAQKWWKWGGPLFSGGSPKPNHLGGLAPVIWGPRGVTPMKSTIVEFQDVCTWQYARYAKGLENRRVILAPLALLCTKELLPTWKKLGGKIGEMPKVNTTGENILELNLNSSLIVILYKDEL